MFSLNPKGQVLLAVVLVMVVALTVALSVAVRTITNIRTANEDETSQRAFSAAESGIEQALTQGNNNPISGSLTNNSTYQTTISIASGNGFLVKNGTSVLKDEPVDVWLSTYPSYSSPWTGNLVVNWGKTGEVCNSSETINTQSAIEITIISGTKASPKVTQYTFDPCAARASNNKFQTPITPGDLVSGKSFAYKSPTITVSSGLIMRIVPLYATNSIGIEGAGLPSQGTVITSVGISDTTQRKIISFRGYPKLPIELFPFVMFSPK